MICLIWSRGGPTLSIDFYLDLIQGTADFLLPLLRLLADLSVQLVSQLCVVLGLVAVGF